MTKEEKKEKAISYFLLKKTEIEKSIPKNNIWERANRIESEFYEMAIKALEQEPKWIPVSERLPEESLGVLVWCPTRKNIYCAYYEEKQWWIFGAYWEKVTEEIVAWMPMPKTYREVENE